MYNYRKIGAEIAPYLTKKFYYWDKCNNIFIKKCSKDFYDYNEIRFYGSYIIISNLHYKIVHKTKIENLVNWKTLQEFWEIFNNYKKMQKHEQSN